MLLVEDVTLAALERQMLLTERLTTAGRLAAGVAHELNNPLATIAGCAESLHGRLDEGDPAGLSEPADFRHYLRLIEEEAYRCKEITGSLLQFVRDPGSQRGATDLNGVVLKAAELLSHQSRFARSRVVTELDAGLPTVAVNEGQLRQVCLGLASNALEAMEGRGTLIIRSRRTRDEVEIELEDEGPGIPTENLGRIFDPFFTTKPPGQGGARPRDRPGHRERSPRSNRGQLGRRQGQRLPRGAAAVSRQIRVLVADDERNLRELIVRELARRGHDVDGAEDGVAALERIRETSYDVVILDMRMPKKEGLDVLRDLSTVPEAPQVIMLTGFQEVAAAVEAMKLGAYDYLTKPTKIEELDVIVRKAAEKGQLVRDNVALRAHAPGAAPFGGLLTQSARMHEVLRIIDRVAPTDSAVLVLGESGTGKGSSPARSTSTRRATRAFVPIHCGALPREVFESELFGHERGRSPARSGPSPVS